MTDALQLKMETKTAKLEGEEYFVHALKHLNLHKNDPLFWGDDDDETDRKKRTKQTSKQDWRDAEFGERLDLNRNCWEVADELDRLAELKDLSGFDQAEIARLCSKVEQKRYKRQ